MMTPAKVRSRVRAIKAVASDSERAHALEDALHSEVLRAIAEGHDEPDVLAAEALETEALEFDRWMA